MSWESAIHAQQLGDGVIRLRRELECAYERIRTLEGKTADTDPEFYEKEYHDSSSPYWMQNLFVSQ